MLSIIVALNDKNVIGNQNKLIWHISNDLKRFKKITTGKTIVMGRKTFESLPGVLPSRKHIVITKNKEYIVPDDRVIIIHDIKEIMKYENSSEEFFIIGGGEIYKQLLPYCKRLYLTKIVSTQEGDTYFPEFDINKYRVIEEENNVENNVKYSFEILEKI
jgi:dihydrofolate reductase